MISVCRYGRGVPECHQQFLIQRNNILELGFYFVTTKFASISVERINVVRVLQQFSSIQQ